MADTTSRKRGVFLSIAETIAPRFPDLRKKLRMADSKEQPITFLLKAVTSTVFISLSLLLVSALFMFTNGISLLWIVLLAFVFPLAVFGYFMLYPEAAIIKRRKELNYEIVFACRHIVIALQSGMPLFDTFVGASSGYGAVSKEFVKIVDKVIVGVPTTQAIREVAHENPSPYFVRILMQIANSLASGADVGEALESVLNQISKEQMIQLKEYSQKLTPIVMFYMVFGIIVPSLGVVLATVVFSAISGGELGLTSVILVPTFFLIAIVQFLFLGVMESSRPRYLI
ncbi:MAG: type II secretion system F family protein [Candidatus Micrarchaeota archaeon]